MAEPRSAEAKLAERVFTLSDQHAFARWSGDCNPVHVDAAFARRTQFGEPIVHGVHGLFWALEAAAPALQGAGPWRGLNAQFLRPMTLGERVECVLKQTDLGFSLELRVGRAAVTKIKLTREPGLDFGAAIPEATPTPTLSRPRPLNFADMDAYAGAVAYAAPELAAAFASAARLFGKELIEAIGASTYVVGMECPGLHSIYSELNAELGLQTAPAGIVRFAVDETDERMRALILRIETPALRARIRAFARVPPIEAPSMADIAPLVRPGEFAGQTALIIGGSRGLGAASAKIIAAGGGRVALTYALGAREAQDVAADIQAFGAPCEVLHHDVLQDPQALLAAAPAGANAFYYFATSKIGRRRTQAFEPALFSEFMAIHVEAFARLVLAARAHAPGRLAFFYPSSTIGIDHSAKEHAEYAAAKRAAESVSQSLSSALRDTRFVVTRLPPIDTDQNAVLISSATQSPADAMAPIVREMQAAL